METDLPRNQQARSLPASRTVEIRPDLTQADPVQRRSVLGHEVVHADLGHGPARLTLLEHHDRERTADYIATRQLISTRALAHVMHLHLTAAAETLHVDMCTLRARLDGLDEWEPDYLHRAGPQPWQGHA